MVRALSVLLAGAASAALSGCGTTHPLPPYETPLARGQFQNVRTTAYTHTEADHVEYGNHNALGGTLRAAAPAGASFDTALSPTALAASPAEIPATDAGMSPRQDHFTEGGFYPPGSIRPVANVPVAEGSPLHAPGAVAYPAAVNVRPEPLPPVRSSSAAATSTMPASGVGSAAADWSRWPAGTVFRVAATGQVYQVDDYGWALAGRNTIDLYQPTRTAMNAWGTRQVDIEILRWGNPAESLRMLRRHQGYRHIHRMVLELEGQGRAAAALE